VTVTLPLALPAPDATLTRRDALKLGAIGALLVAARAAGAFAGDDGPPFLRRSTFEPLVGSAFTLRAPDGARIRARLEVIEDTAAVRRGAPAERAFSLLFRGGSSAAAAQGTYGLSHRHLGAFELFIVPVGRGVHGQTYQAVVNRTHG
jgi:hypothetical protein